MPLVDEIFDELFGYDYNTSCLDHLQHLRLCCLAQPELQKFTHAYDECIGTMGAINVVGVVMNLGAVIEVLDQGGIIIFGLDFIPHPFTAQGVAQVILDNLVKTRFSPVTYIEGLPFVSRSTQ
ncbi:hypothetical protein ACJX0J_007210 [Zea mays]